MSTKPAMSEHEPHHLPVLPNSGKLEKLREGQATSAPVPAPTATPPAPPPTASKHCDSTLVSRFADSTKTPTQKAIEEKVVAALRNIYDPEIPVNIYDLGLIYAIEVDRESSKVHVRMTLTAPGCPVAGDLVAQVEATAEAIEEVPSATVELVWDPPWSREMMSEAARLELGLL